MQSPFPGKIILLNGASSAGKSTLLRALQDQLEEPFLRFSMDLFLFSGQILPTRREPDGPFAWKSMRPALFQGFLNCLPALVSAGNNLLVEFIVEDQDQFQQLVQLVGPLDTFFVGVHCSLEELERRELARGDRGTGDARRDFETVHTFSRYDFEVDSTLAAEWNAARIIEAWKIRQRPGVLGASWGANSVTELSREEAKRVAWCAKIPGFLQLSPEERAALLLKYRMPPNPEAVVAQIESEVVVDPYWGMTNEYLAEEARRILEREVVVTGELEPLHRCPCCFYETLEERGMYEICVVCFWEDNYVEDPSQHSSPNHITLGEGRANFAAFGACREQDLPFVDPDGRRKYRYVGDSPQGDE